MITCHCGLPLHYTNPAMREYVQKLVEDFGPEVVVTVDGVGSFAVPRHYIALHGLKGAQVQHLGFERVA